MICRFNSIMNIEDNTKRVPEGQSILLLKVTELIHWILEFRRYFEDAIHTRLGLNTVLFQCENTRETSYC